MKKIVYILIGILVGLFVLLSLLTPGDDYAAEKRLWKITKQYTKFAHNPQAGSTPEIEHIIHQANEFIRHHPKSPLVPHAHVLIADAYILKRDYTAGRQKLEQLIQMYADQSGIVETVIAKIINSYYEEENSGEPPTAEKRNFKKRVRAMFNERQSKNMLEMFDSMHEGRDFNLMLRTYQRAIQDFPTTSTGIQAPFLIARLYHDEEKHEQSQKALDDAIQYYQNFSLSHQKTSVGLQAQELLVSCYLIQKKLRLALETLGDMLMGFSDTKHLTQEKVLQITGLINQLSSQIMDFGPSVAIYQKFIAAYPDHKFERIVEEKFKELKILLKTTPL